MHSEISHGGNPNPNRPMLAFHFLRALARIRCSRARHTSPSLRSTTTCGRRIRRAAYASMALAAGPRRVWSRAVLHSLRRQAGAPTLANRRLVTVGRKMIRAAGQKPRERVGGNQEDELRRLVPGGWRMDFCSLLEETGNYIHLLKAPSAVDEEDCRLHVWIDEQLVTKKKKNSPDRTEDGSKWMPIKEYRC